MSETVALGLGETKIIDLTDVEHATIELSEHPTHSTLEVHGELDMVSCQHLHEYLMRVCDIPGNEVLVDLRGVTFVDSTGLGVLVNARQRAISMGSHIRLLLPDGKARFPFEVTGLVELFSR